MFAADARRRAGAAPRILAPAPARRA